MLSQWTQLSTQHIHGEWITLWFLHATSSLAVLVLRLSGIIYYNAIIFQKDNRCQYNPNLNADQNVFHVWKYNSKLTSCP